MWRLWCQGGTSVWNRLELAAENQDCRGIAVDGCVQLLGAALLVTDLLVALVQSSLVVTASVPFGPGEGLAAGQDAVSALAVLAKGTGHGVMGQAREPFHLALGPPGRGIDGHHV